MRGSSTTAIQMLLSTNRFSMLMVQQHWKTRGHLNVGQWVTLEMRGLPHLLQYSSTPLSPSALTRSRLEDDLDQPSAKRLRMRNGLSGRYQISCAQVPCRLRVHPDVFPVRLPLNPSSAQDRISILLPWLFGMTKLVPPIRCHCAIGPLMGHFPEIPALPSHRAMQTAGREKTGLYPRRYGARVSLSTPR
jgi:hypothetical protein